MNIVSSDGKLANAFSCHKAKYFIDVLGDENCNQQINSIHMPCK